MEREYEYYGGGISEQEQRERVAREKPGYKGKGSPEQRERQYEINRRRREEQKSKADVLRGPYAELVDNSLGGSKTFTAKEVKRGYRHMGKC